mgnify:CR=1 FL=1|jgi:hypothetical protein
MGVNELLVNDHLDTLLVRYASQKWLDPAVLVLSLRINLLVLFEVVDHFGPYL